MTDRTRFGAFTDAEVRQIARAFSAARGEGVRIKIALAAELATEFDQRGLPIPWAYSEQDERGASSREWLKPDYDEFDADEVGGYDKWLADEIAKEAIQDRK